MSILRFIDTDKSINTSGEDYLPLSNYHDSFYNAPNLSQLRMAKVPGTVKYFNRAFDDTIEVPYVGSRSVKNPTTVSQAAITPLPPRNNYDDCDYASYPKLN